MQAPKLLEMLQSLIETPSVSCTSAALDQSNIAVINQLATWLESLGFKTTVQPLPNLPGKANLIATLGRGTGGLVLAGHTDTVPYDDTHWSQSPFSLTERDGRLYGLGTCDMKGFFPIAIEAARRFAGSQLKAPLTIVATSDEESSMAGARALAAADIPQARFAVIGEPTDFRPIFAHKGFMMLSISLQGSSGHSSDPELGHNALDAMHCVMGELLAFRAQLAAVHRNPAFGVSVPTLNLGCLTAGDNPNRICDHADLQIDLRLLPGMDTEATIAALEIRLARSAQAHGTSIKMRPVSPPVTPFSTPSDGKLVRTLERLSGTPAGTVAFGTEGPFLQALGMETVIFGPGSIDQAHQPDEYLSTQRIQPAVDVLTQLIAEVCVDSARTGQGASH
jgi:acetylornithine deacetylase